MKKVSVTIALMCGVLSVGAQAQTCIDAPDCKTLGYLYSEKECQGMSSVRCPYDDSRYFCIQGSTDAYDSNIGDILYDDFTTSPNIISTTKPIGVVITTGRDVNYAIALQNASSTSTTQVYANSTSVTAPNYTTQGTILGDWEIPTIDLLQVAYYNKDKVNDTINRVGGMVLTGSYMATNKGSLSMSDGSTSTSGTALRTVIKLNPPAGMSYEYTYENCDGVVEGGIYHGKFTKCRPVQVGDYLTTDKKFAIHLDKSLINKAVGVVFDTEKRLAVARTAHSELVPWSSNNCDIPELENCTRENYKTCATDGRANTNILLAADGGCAGEMIAAKAANEYEDKNCTAEFCQKGKWFLPSMSELYSRFNVYQIEKTLKKIGYENTTSYGWYYYEWSSNDTGNGALAADSNSSIASIDKTKKDWETEYIRYDGTTENWYYYMQVRPVLAY